MKKLKKSEIDSLLEEILETLKDVEDKSESVHFELEVTNKTMNELCHLDIRQLQTIIQSEILQENADMRCFIHPYPHIGIITFGFASEFDLYHSDTFKEYGLICAEAEAEDRLEEHIRRLSKRKENEKIIIKKQNKVDDDLPF